MSNVPVADRDVLRRLAARTVDATQSHENAERREAWYRHDEGAGGRPMILAEISGIRDERRPIIDSDLECEDPWARGVEHRLRYSLYEFEVLKDDHVIEPYFDLKWRIDLGNYGVEKIVQSGDHDGKMGSKRWDAPIKDLDTDFAKLEFREFTVDREATAREIERVESVFGDILPTRTRGWYYWTMGLTIRAIDLIGLEGLMLAMYDNPDGLHRLMAFLRDDHLRMADWLENEGLYSLNNENDYIGSGSMGYTRALPADDDRGNATDGNATDGNATAVNRRDGSRVRKRDLWVLSESQETVGVGPELFEEFVYPYQRDIVERFGRCYYGCCEPVHNRWHIIRNLPRLERVSVSPWADEEFMAEALGNRIVYSRKPAPSMISARVFNEEEIRSDIRHTLDVANGCRIELIMKDVHTLANEPERLPRWVEIAREEVGRG